MTATSFTLDPNLKVCTHYVASLALSDVLLMDDARFPWLILVPRCADAVEMIDLPDAQQLELWREISHTAAVLREAVACDKLNIGALGNQTRQLHVHVIARTQGDAAWSGPVWGHGAAQAYAAPALHARIELLREQLIR